MPYLVLTSQLPPAVQSTLKDWMAARDEITKQSARIFIIMVRKTITEKGIPLDQGNRDLNRLLEVRSEEFGKREPPGSCDDDPLVLGEKKHMNPQEYSSAEYCDDIRVEGVNTLSRRNPSSGLPRTGSSAGKWTKSQGKRPACFVCGDTRHFQRKCPRQYCQQCGKQVHHRRDCFSAKRVMTLEVPAQQGHQDGNAIQSGVVIRVCLNGHAIQALLDSDAQPSVVDVQSLKAIGAEYTPGRSRVHSVALLQSRQWVEYSCEWMWGKAR